jgi:integrase/recombinase XerD
MKAYLEPDEAEKLEKTATNLRDRLIIGVLFHSGCRVSEALALQTNNIDFKAGTVTIQHLKSRINLSCPKCSTKLGKSHVYCPKCGVEVKNAIAKMEKIIVGLD